MANRREFEIQQDSKVLVDGITIIGDGVDTPLEAVGGGSGGNGYDRSPDGIKVSVGALPIGYVPNGTIQDLLNDMLYPFIQPTTGFSISPTLAEKGTTVNPVNLNWNINEQDDTLTQVRLYRGLTLLNTNTSTSGTFSDTSGIVWNAPSLTWRLEADYSTTGTVTRNRTLNFVAPSYWGSASVGLNEAGIKAQLTKVLITNNNQSFTYNPILERYYFVYPQSLGVISQILDPNGFDVTPSFIQDTATFTLADGVTNEDYYIYYSNADTTQTSFTLTFS